MRVFLTRRMIARYRICGVLLAILCSGAVHGQLPERVSDGGREFERGLFFQRRYEFDSALVHLQRARIQSASDRTPQDLLREIDKHIMECNSGKKLIASPRNFVITNLGPTINSAYEDYAPVLNADETLLVFTSRRPESNANPSSDNEGNFYEDVYFTRKEQGAWHAAQNMGRPINSPYHNSNVALSSDGKKLYLYTDQGGGDILISEFTGTYWTSPRSLPSPINTPYRESSLSVSADGSRIFVASERPGGRGGSDLYLVEKNSAGQWLPATNLGTAVNTAWDEDSPFFDTEGQILYFSSRGHNTMGGFDLFRSRWINDHWEPAENLGAPINTPEHDSYFVSTRDGRRAYYSSVRAGGFGKEDIYRIELPVELTRRAATVNDSLDTLAVVHRTMTFYFETGSTRLSVGSLDTLRILSADLHKFPHHSLQIDGHTDDIGNVLYNEGLSMERAQAVAGVLLQMGVANERMMVTGWGLRRPRESRPGEKGGRAYNRRVEIRVIDN